MPQTQLKGLDIGDGTICRPDLNTNTPGQAVIRRIVTAANSGIKIISSTGADTGTGDVVLGIEMLVQTITNALDANSGLSAIMTLTANTTITFSNLIAGQSGNLTVTNTATLYTLTFAGYTNKISPAVYRASNSVIVSGGSKIDVFSWYYDGVYLFWNGTNNYM